MAGSKTIGDAVKKAELLERAKSLVKSAAGALKAAPAAAATAGPAVAAPAAMRAPGAGAKLPAASRVQRPKLAAAKQALVKAAVDVIQCRQYKQAALVKAAQALAIARSPKAPMARRQKAAAYVAGVLAMLETEKRAGVGEVLSRLAGKVKGLAQKGLSASPIGQAVGGLRGLGQRLGGVATQHPGAAGAVGGGLLGAGVGAMGASLGQGKQPPVTSTSMPSGSASAQA